MVSLNNPLCQNCILLPSPTKNLTEYRTLPTRKDPSKDNSKQECTVTSLSTTITNKLGNKSIRKVSPNNPSCQNITLLP